MTSEARSVLPGVELEGGGPLVHCVKSTYTCINNVRDLNLTGDLLPHEH